MEGCFQAPFHVAACILCTGVTGQEQVLMSVYGDWQVCAPG